MQINDILIAIGKDYLSLWQIISKRLSACCPI